MNTFDAMHALAMADGAVVAAHPADLHGPRILITHIPKGGAQRAADIAGLLVAGLKAGAL